MEKGASDKAGTLVGKIVQGGMVALNYGGMGVAMLSRYLGAVMWLLACFLPFLAIQAVYQGGRALKSVAGVGFDPSKTSLWTMYSNPMWPLLAFKTREVLHAWNSSAALFHAALFLLFLFNRTNIDVPLKVDRVFIEQAAPGASAGIGGCLANEFYLPGTPTAWDPLRAQYVYPMGQGRISLVLLIASFPFLSFLFQVAVSFDYILVLVDDALVRVWKGRQPTALAHEGWDIYKLMYEDEIFSTSLAKTAAAQSDRHFNFLRYIEYSISASVMLMAIAILSGIVDSDLLACIFSLSFVCMICGLVAEMVLRFYQVVKQTPGSGVLFQSAVLLHALGWFCVLLAWGVILAHYDGWTRLQDPTDYCYGESPKYTAPKPPDFVLAIIVIQFVLFSSFGVVQIYQLAVPEDTLRGELAYITLSLTAKGFLVIILAANIFFRPDPDDP